LDNTRRNILEEFIKQKEANITAQYNDNISEDGAFTRDVMASSQITSDGYSLSNKTIYEKGDIANMKQDFMKNIKKMEKELGLTGQLS